MLSLERVKERMEAATPNVIVAWAVETFSANVALSSSFQMQSLPLLHIVSQVAPQLPVLFLDTGYHFPETLTFRDQIVQAWGLNLKIVRAAVSHGEFIVRYGDALFRQNPDLCCYINKVEPMQRALAGLQAWISGIRRDQSPSRKNAQVVEQTAQGTVRIHPMARWTRRDVWQYIHDHNLPEHPLLTQGYLSVGCAPCTRRVYEGEEERNGRWAGREKTECGLHTFLRHNGATNEETKEAGESYDAR